MTLNRRSALYVLGLLLGGFVGKHELHAQTTGDLGVFDPTAKMSVSLSLDQWSAITVMFKGETISIDPAELFAALKEK